MAGTSAERDRIVIGFFQGAHGLHGEVALQRTSGAPSFPYQRLLVGDRELSVARARKKVHHLWLIKFRELATREEASALNGLPAEVPRTDLPSLPADGSFYLCDLPGAALVNEKGAPLGHVRQVVTMGDRDMIELEDGSMVPLDGPFVVAFDAAAKKLIVRLPEGLLGV